MSPLKWIKLVFEIIEDEPTPIADQAKTRGSNGKVGT